MHGNHFLYHNITPFPLVSCKYLCWSQFWNIAPSLYPSISSASHRCYFINVFSPNKKYRRSVAVWTVPGLFVLNLIWQVHRAPLKVIQQPALWASGMTRTPVGLTTLFTLSSLSALLQITFFPTISIVCQVEQQPLYSYCYWPFPQSLWAPSKIKL